MSAGHTGRVGTAVVIGAALLSACSVIGGGGGGTAEAVLHDRTGAEVARATLRPDGDQVRVDVTATAIPAGTHGIHIHAVGSCQAPGFESAGGHFNPANRAHGLENPAGPHNGDMVNMIVGPGEQTNYRSTTTRITLATGASSIFDADGSALVIHASADDQRTDPSGNSGARIACGVIRAR